MSRLSPARIDAFLKDGAALCRASVSHFAFPLHPDFPAAWPHRPQ